MATANITTHENAKIPGGIETVFAELDATISILSCHPETDTVATSAMIHASTARAVLQDVIQGHFVDAPDVKRLQGVIGDMDSLSQAGFSEISAIARLALVALETPEGRSDMEIIAQALISIHSKACDIENVINYQAEEVGCNYRNPNTARRYAAARALREVNHA